MSDSTWQIVNALACVAGENREGEQDTGEKWGTGG